MHVCRICSGAIDRVVAVREMMFGTRACFDYAHCAQCGCWQIVEVPANLAAHYPAEYISHQRPATAPLPDWKLRLNRQRARFDLLRRGWLGRWLSRWRGPLQFGQQWMAGFSLDFSSRILEIGCGTGRRLEQLRELGFVDLTGQDLFSLPRTGRNGAIEWTREPLAALHGPYDWIEAHHAFEHFPEQRKNLQEIQRLLRPGGGLLLRVPVSDSVAAERFGADWAQWDAPRHLYLHTRRSMQQLAESCGLRLRRCIDDGGSFGFWASALYQRDIALTDPRSPLHGRSQHEFSAAEMAEFDADAEAAIRAGRSDQVAFVFERS